MLDLVLGPFTVNRARIVTVLVGVLGHTVVDTAGQEPGLDLIPGYRHPVTDLHQNRKLDQECVATTMLVI